jgi:hypothetical protein
MGREVMRKVATVAGVFSALVAVALAPAIASAAPASAAPVVTTPILLEEDAGKPTAVKISGQDLPGDKIVQAHQNAELFDLLLGQVDWMISPQPQTSKPDDDKLGAKYTVTVLAADQPQHTFDVYPQAAGGPRAFRPADQPKGKVTEGWFYGRLNMSEALRMTGAPLPPQKDQMITGGIGGGQHVDGPELADVDVNVGKVLGDFQRLFLLNGAVVLAIALGLAGMSWLIRRKI